MKDISLALKNDLGKGNLTTAECCKITRADSVVFGFTSADVSISFGGVVYKSSTLGVSASSLESKDNLSVDNMTVGGTLTDGAITKDDLRAGIWDDAAIEFFPVNLKMRPTLKY